MRFRRRAIGLPSSNGANSRRAGGKTERQVRFLIKLIKIFNLFFSESETLELERAISIFRNQSLAIGRPEVVRQRLIVRKWVWRKRCRAAAAVRLIIKILGRTPAKSRGPVNNSKLRRLI